MAERENNYRSLKLLFITFSLWLSLSKQRKRKNEKIRFVTKTGPESQRISGTSVLLVAVATLARVSS